MQTWRSWVFGGLCIGFFTASALAKVKVVIEVDPEEPLDPKDLAIVVTASEVVFDRIATHRVAQCAYRHAFRENKQMLRKKWGKQIPILNKSEQVKIRIGKRQFSKDALGVGKVGVAEIDRKDYVLRHLTVTLSEKDLNRDVVRYAERVGSKKVLDRWVSTIAHELAHNFGYRHGLDGKSWEDNYAGYFATELGFCVMTDGRYGSDLGDEAKRAKWRKKFGFR